ncbi:MAG: hypothetical protein R2865_17580 [Deinococcales bacterium]
MGYHRLYHHCGCQRLSLVSLIALALARRFFGRGAMRTAMLIPWAIITVVSSLIWEWMFKSDRSGLFTMLLNRLGFIEDSGQITWLINPALPAS